MRTTTSEHCQSIRTQSTQLWANHRGRAFKPCLNVPLLSELLEGAISYHASVTPGKRKAPDSPQTPIDPKRSKVAVPSESDVEDLGEDALAQDLIIQYPEIEGFTVPHEVECVPILHHVLRIQYTSHDDHPPNDLVSDMTARKKWEREDEELCDYVFSLSESLSSPQTVDLGEIRFGEHEGRVVALSHNHTMAKDVPPESWLFLIPALAVDGPSNNFKGPSSTDFFYACLHLQAHGRARVDTRLKAVIQPHDPSALGPHLLPFSLDLELTISCVVPEVFRPIVQTTKKLSGTIEDAQRRLLRTVYITEELFSDKVNDAINVSSFYSIMGPGPTLPTEEGDAAMQPTYLLPKLLPFQRQSVAWLLDREGMAINPDGSIVPKDNYDEFSFWSRIEAGNQIWYMNRLTGALSQEPPPAPVIFGGILAEEPGLGKTLEIIALILLNPAPLNWNPTMARWDPIGQLNVRAVKTTLIVTPVALAHQWKEELENHAPSLKVLVYDGWAKLRVPITKNDREIERVSGLKRRGKGKAKSTSAKSKSKPKLRSKTKSKRQEVDKENEEPMDVEQEFEPDLTIGEDGEPLDWCDYVHQFDVVITTFQVLRLDFNVARAAPDRPRREDVVYASAERPRSPLVMVEWKRVIMDEVQMAGGGKAEDMVALIPRLASFAVSGTPARAQMSDLIHVFRFLRVDQIIGSIQLWKRLLRPGFLEEFKAFLQHYSIRTIKANITQQLTIPQQTRFLVGIELGKVQKHVYDQTLETVLLELGLDARGVAGSAGWQVDGALLRSAIRRLRGICTHPQVGQLKQRNGVLKSNALKSMDEVLAAMKEQNWRNMVEDWRRKLLSLIKYAQLQKKDQNNGHGYREALETLNAAEKDTIKHLAEIHTALDIHDEKGKVLKEEAARLRHERKLLSPPETHADPKGKGKERERELNVDEGHQEEDGDREEEDPEEQGLPKTPAGDEHRQKRSAIKMRIREGNLVMHQVQFLQGDLYHVLGNAKEEDAAYAAAEKLRRDLLKVTEVDASKAVDTLASNAARKGLNLEGMLIELPFLGGGGIRSTDLFDEFNAIIETVLNEQSKLLWKWRSHILGLLLKPLNPGDEADGQEYQRTLDDQGEAEIYLQAYTALLSDRREALSNERTLLAAHEVREKRLRHTKAAIKAANAAIGVQLEIPEDMEIQPEHEVMHKDLSATRKEILLGLKGRAAKSVLIELNAAAATITPDSHPEKVIIRDAVERNIRPFISEQSSLQDKLDADLAFLRKAFNQRILYFRQLQEISDSVAEVTWEEATLAGALQVCSVERGTLEAKINTARARHRYLENMTQTHSEGDIDEDENCCILCRHEFTRGFITQCAHVFCEGCMKVWLARKEGKTCPVCRVAVDPSAVQRFTVDAVNTEPPPQPVQGEPAPKSTRRIVYNIINSTIFADIQTIETYGDYGSKIQTLVRHLRYIQLTDAGAKSIVFSAWADSLHIVEFALSQNGIPCLRIDQNSKNDATHLFRTNPGILVLLLHGERENAGLNVTCASRVFLLESVVHHSFEIQAIARIDRLGQRQKTEVYCYYAEDTIERNILDLAARKGLSLYTKENAVGTLNVSSLAQDDYKDIDGPEKNKSLQKGDFIYKVDDMLAILFPHMYEDVEYLLPSEDEDVDMHDANVDLLSQPRIPRFTESNAVAGPSRSRW